MKLPELIGFKSQGRRWSAILAASLATLVCSLCPNAAFAQLTDYVDPVGYPAAWPTEITSQAYTAKGSSQFDLTGASDNSRNASLSGSVDFSSGASNDQPSINFFSDGSILYVRLRVDGPPLQVQGNGEPFDSETWNVLLDIDGDGFKEFAIMLDGEDSNSEPDDIVVIYENTNSQKFVIAQDGVWRQDSAVGSDDGVDGETGGSGAWDLVPGNGTPEKYIWD
jgi:hypothetical protein